MCAAVLPCNSLVEHRATAASGLASVRQAGGVELTFRSGTAGTYAADVGEMGGYRALLPRSEHGVEAVLINTGGGMAGGDRAEHAVTAAPAASALVTTAAAERIYRTLGPRTEVQLRLTVGEGARLAWLPQETIIYDRAVLARRTIADVHPAGRLTLLESVVLGRQAMGETVTAGGFADTWRVRRGGRLILAESIALAGDIAATMQRRAVGSGAHVMATLVHVGPDAGDLLEPVRAAVGHPDPDCGVSAWNGMLVMRLLGRDPGVARRSIARAAPLLMGRAMPRTWWT